MRRVQVRSASGDVIHMIAVEEQGNLVYVIALNALEALENGLTEPVGCPKEDVIYQDDI